MSCDLRNCSIAEIEALTEELQLQHYRSTQIARWVFARGADSIADMTDLSRTVRRELASIAHISSATPERIDTSTDGSQKFRFRTSDGHGIETVAIPEKKHLTICISTQIGCAMGCRFCYTGRNGLVRDLTQAEILNQVIAVLRTGVAGSRIPNLVFMGMGEPLANYRETLRAIDILLHPDGLHFSRRRITVSTCGLAPRIGQLGADAGVGLAISLNAPDDALRSSLMPINDTYPLAELLDAARRFPCPPRSRITFEYILIRDVNDSDRHAVALAQLLRNIPCKINLIPFNEHPAVAFRAPAPGRAEAFQQVLQQHSYTAPIRYSKGSDIAAACGQLGDRDD